MSMQNIRVGVEPKQFAMSGRYFKLISCSGVARVRFSFDDGSELETELYQGLGLKLDRQFSRFYIESNTEQDAVVFASTVELIDERSETSITGAASIQSGAAALAAGVVSEVVPLGLGRRSILIQCDDVMYVGGANLDATNGVKVDAGESIEINTQAAIYALSASAQTVRYLIEVS